MINTTKIKGVKKVTITAKYSGRCKRCGGWINAGEKVEWEKGEGVRHLECPAKAQIGSSEPRKMISMYDGMCVECGHKITAGEEIYYLRGKGAWHVDCEAAKAAEKAKEEERRAAAPWRVSGGSGYGYGPYTVGEVIQASRHILDKGGPEYLTVVRASKRYYSEDGLSFGVGDDSGYIYIADCREATAEEAAPLIEKKRLAAEKRAAKQELAAITADIKENGERPEGEHVPEGEALLDTFTVYGGGERLVIGPEYIWYLRNNGGDGDNWSLNNVRTGGAGAIGWRIPLDETLATRLRALAQILA
jgi:hypothetical protein